MRITKQTTPGGLDADESTGTIGDDMDPEVETSADGGTHDGVRTAGQLDVVDGELRYTIGDTDEMEDDGFRAEGIIQPEGTEEL
jgi:hypothetical protein